MCVAIVCPLTLSTIASAARATILHIPKYQIIMILYRSRDVHTPMLQEVFDGYKEGVLDMIAIMESLGVHARKVMWTNLSPPSPVDPTEYPPCAEVTCGPVWDYDWD